MTQQELITELRNRILSDEELYNALVASIESAIKEIPPDGTWLHDAAVAVADRIIGREE